VQSRSGISHSHFLCAQRVCTRTATKTLISIDSNTHSNTIMTEQMQLTSMFHNKDTTKTPRQSPPSFDIPKKHSRQTHVAPTSYALQSDLDVKYVCNGCGKSRVCDKAPASFVRCSCCKAVYYCGKACQAMDWKHSGIATRNMSHQLCCPEFCNDKEEFLENPNGATVRRQVFPWADQHHSNDVFSLGKLLERRGLNGNHLGFWARPDPSSSKLLHEYDKNGWCHGQMLLEESFPSIQEGFSILKECEIPSGPAISNRPCSWAEYASSRNLSSSSIAPLLLTDVLTIYHMIVNELKLNRRKPRNGKHFVVCILGAASELNYLPLLQELAFLLPRGMDVELRFISPAVKHLMNKAFWKYPESHLMVCGDYIINKTAPNGGRVRVSMERQQGLFHKVKFRSVPDAAIALNADLDSSDDWSKTFVKLIARETPFCVSEPTKYSLRFARDALFPEWIQEFNDTFRAKHPTVKVPKRTIISLNPFHGIVEQAHGAIMVPNLSNGYILTWIPPTFLPEPRKV